jgi:hypothetical protein
MSFWYITRWSSCVSMVAYNPSSVLHMNLVIMYLVCTKHVHMSEYHNTSHNTLHTLTYDSESSGQTSTLTLSHISCCFLIISDFAVSLLIPCLLWCLGRLLGLAFPALLRPSWRFHPNIHLHPMSFGPISIMTSDKHHLTRGQHDCWRRCKSCQRRSPHLCGAW